MLSALRIRAFRTLALLYTANAVLEWFGSVALMVVVYDATGSALVAAAMLVCKQVLPAGIVAPFGSVIDRVALRRVLGGAFAAQAAALALLAVTGYGLWVFPAALIAGASSGISRAALRTGVARTLGGADLRAGNALLNLVLGVAVPLGPAIAAAVVATTSAEAAFAIGALGMAALATLGLCVALPSHTAHDEQLLVEDDDDEQAPNPARGRLVAPVSWLLVLGGFTTGVSMISEPSLLAFSRDSLAAGVAGYGALHMAWSVGITIGSVLFSRLLSWPMLRVYTVATLGSAAGYFAVGLSPSIELACAFAVLGGIGTGMDWVAIVTAVQEATSSDRQGEVAAKLESFALAGPAVGIVLGGVVAELATARWAILVPGFLSLAVVVVGYAALKVRSAGPRRPAIPLSPTSVSGGSI